MSWSQEKIIKFIEEFRKSFSLWDTRLSEYKNNKAKLGELQKLATKFDCDVATIKKKIKNLRSAFRREQKQLSGSSKKRSTWFAYDLLLFILDVENPRSGYASEVEFLAEQPTSDEVCFMYYLPFTRNSVSVLFALISK